MLRDRLQDASIIENAGLRIQRFELYLRKIPRETKSEREFQKIEEACNKAAVI